jgi:hypothetical protein
VSERKSPSEMHGTEPSPPPCLCDGCRLTRQARTIGHLRAEVARRELDTAADRSRIEALAGERNRLVESCRELAIAKGKLAARNEQLERQDGEREDEVAELRRSVAASLKPAPRPAGLSAWVSIDGTEGVSPIRLTFVGGLLAKID